MRRQLEVRTRRFELLEAKLMQLSPLRILERGYAIVTQESGAVITSSEAAPPGTAIGVRLAKGRLKARVE
jgi:exodeoxyribonuclease VII large subunit